MPNVKKALMAASVATGGGASGKKLFVWGNNDNGGLGLGNTTALSSPVQLGAAGDWQRACVSGRGHSLFLKPDGSMWSCGDGLYGATGHSNTTDLSSPVQIGSLTTWAWISTVRQGQSGGQIKPRSAAIKTDGSLWMWGCGAQGALGRGNTTNYSSPVQVGALTTWKKVMMGRYFTTALKTDGTIWSWGSGLGGRLGNGSSANISSPVQIGTYTGWIDISCGGDAAAGIRSDGKTFCWGNNYYGNLGNNERGGVGGAANQSSPVQVSGSETFTSIALGYNQCVAVQANGTMFSWGLNRRGQLGFEGPGTGVNDCVSSPVQIGSLTTWAGFGVTDSGGSNILGFGNLNGVGPSASGDPEFQTSWAKTKTDGTLWSWGNGGAGAIGRGNTTSYSSPVQIGTSTSWVSAYAAYGAAWAFEE
tara:strand:- start:1258 stop:2511 length:1254 start_codon:yes stop_codon:yes gene_type:complete